MRWSWKIGRFVGIDVFIHATFVLLLGFIGLTYYLNDGPAAAIRGIGFILALFACVVLHEYGHALTARRYNIKTRDITLYPIGGVARLERMPDDPVQELWVALAGPAVNVVIAIILATVMFAVGGLAAFEQLGIMRGSFLERLMILNVFLVVFNLLPAFPMDGGRVLRALLATRLDYVRATRVAANVGQAMALLFGFAGLFFNPFLVFIAIFVWIGAGQEASMVQMKSAFDGFRVEAAMQTSFRTLTPHDTLQDATRLILSGAQQDFPVLQDGAVVGVLTRQDLMTALAENRQETPVEAAMHREFQTAESGEMLTPALTRLQEATCQTMPVFNSGRLIGLLTRENVGEFLMIQSALQNTRAATGTPLPSNATPHPPRLF